MAGGWTRILGGGTRDGLGPADQAGDYGLAKASGVFDMALEIDRIRDAAERAARSAGVEVVDVEWKVGRERFLRVSIDKPEGVNHSDCRAVSEQLSALLDVEGLVPGPPYVLEVSSPGLDRKLRGPANYQRFAGRRAKISLDEPIENSKFFEGRLAGCADGMVQLDVQGRVVSLPIAAIRKANLVVEF